ncbi:class I adenylate-forming enzyme family protein [Streptomyces sp. WI04-05B]|uniref:class I adenylate-forming enzyme family protein n=1 Tax=Streptomyces TaxID=1883 RepID=UPI0029AE2981|nr:MULTISPECIES: AMP-binding protein [unclassified Streptomyces]MDX2546971.1 AMP-binding protein [Streptomyces sp. WI04-05B]MDX2589355.1 AMP-binding protein [Streptomyces sp. WI04-05A]MDX3748139.1 AMP-binding protein [Streptomyces sp. AK08-02]
MTSTFGAHLAVSAAEAGHRTALVFDDRTWTYAELDLAVRRAIARLDKFGVGKGDRVVMQGAARPEALITLFAVTRMGAVLVPLHPQTTEGELAVVCEETGPTALVADEAFPPAPVLRLAWEELHPEDDGPEAVAHATPDGSDTAIIAFTSGTSGRPKGVALTHDNLYWSMVGGLARLPFGADDTALVSTPLAHVAVLGGLPQYTWARRGTVILAPRFDPDLFVDLVRDHKVTCAFAVPAMSALLARHPRFGSEDLDTLRWILSGGSPAQTATREQFRARGVGVVNSYGLTETAAGVTYSAPDEPAASTGSPVPQIELRVVDTAGSAVPADVAGEIRARGPSVATEYWSASGPVPVTDEEGWFHTGDRGLFDAEGRLSVVGRLKDTIITGGENIDPAEVENALADFPGVVEVAVSGTPDPVWGELVTAFLVTDSGAPTLDDIRAHLDGRLARHKWPRRLSVVPALPRGATGKLQRARLTTLLDN